MADFERTSQMVQVDALDRPLLDAIRSMLARHELDIVLVGAIAACRTESVPRRRRRLFGPKHRPHVTAAILTPTWLLWATDASGVPVAAMCRLTDGEVKRFRSDASDDVGLEVTGFLAPDAPTRSTAFVPVDAGSAGTRFAQLVIDTAAAARG